jgi:hypothetical protein
VNVPTGDSSLNAVLRSVMRAKRQSHHAARSNRLTFMSRRAEERSGAGLPAGSEPRW